MINFTVELIVAVWVMTLWNVAVIGSEVIEQYEAVDASNNKEVEKQSFPPTMVFFPCFILSSVLVTSVHTRHVHVVIMYSEWLSDMDWAIHAFDFVSPLDKLEPCCCLVNGR